MDASTHFPLDHSPPQPALGWVWLGLSSLLLSSFFGLFLILSRTPWLSQWLATTPSGFSRALVYHVDFAVIVWFLSMAGAFITRNRSITQSPLNRAALTLTWSGTIILLFAGISNTAQAVLSNYVPVLNSAFFIAGLSLLWLAASLLAWLGLSPLFESLRQRLRDPMQTGTMAGSLSLLSALTAFLIVAWHLADNATAAPDFNTLFWAGGHMMQLAHVLLLLTVWLFLTEPFQVGPYSPWLASLFGIALLPTVIGLVFLFFVDIPSNTYHLFFTNFMKYASWWAVPGIALALLPCRQKILPFFSIKDPILVSVCLSVILLTQGITVGTMIEGDTVLVTAHYHAAVGAVTLGYMGLARRLLADAKITIFSNIWNIWQPWLFGSGVFLLTLGLALSGFHGVERKTPGLTTASWEEILGMTLASVGGSLAMAGVVLFSLFPLLTLRQRLTTPSKINAFIFHHRFRVLIFTLFAIALASQLLERLPSPYPTIEPSPTQPPPSPSKVSSDSETLRQRFLEGALLLQAKRHADAAAIFHLILQENPRIPEAQANMGFAVLGLGKVRAALDFFQGALALNPYQTNAYFGLAVALEAEGELETALGAMRSYVHMSPDTDPWLPRARSALWEWENELANQKKQPAKNPEKPKQTQKPEISTPIP